MKCCFSLKALFSASLNYPVIQVQTSAGTTTQNFYGDYTGTSLTTSPNGAGTSYAAWASTNGTGYITIWYDQSYYVNGSGVQNNATASGTQRPYMNTGTTPWSVDFSGSSSVYMNLVSGTVPMNGSYTFCFKASSTGTSGSPGLIGAGNNAGNQCNNFRYYSGYPSSGYWNYWYGNDAGVVLSSGTVPNPTTVSAISYVTGSAPTTTTGVYSSGGNTSTSYTLSGYINGSSATINGSNPRSGWQGVSGNDVLGKTTADSNLQGQMFFGICSSQAVSTNDRVIMETA